MEVESGIEGEWKAMKDLKRMMERMWEDQRRRIEGLKGGMKVLKGVMEQFRRKQEERDRRWQEERRGLVERLET